MKKTTRPTPGFISAIIFSAIVITAQYGCSGDTKANMPKPALIGSTVTAAPAVASTAADAATIMGRQQIPVLCYHQVRDWKASDSKTARAYIVPGAIFAEQMKSLADSGYHSILPDQLYDYLLYGKTLPSKPVMITFDDTRVDQYAVALPELNKYGFKGVFFIMTVALGKPGYMSKEQVRQLADEGNIIGSHTYDHKNVKTYTDKDWEEQVTKPSKQLETITGRQIDYFAYPFGLWNKEAIPNLKHHKFKAAFQLSTERNVDDPVFTIRRIIITGDRNGAGMQKIMTNSFH